MKDKGGCVTSPVRINKLFLTKPICERMLQCTLTSNTKRGPMSRQPEPPNVRKHDLIRSDYKLNFTAKTIIIYALHQSTTSFGVLLHHQADVGNKATLAWFHEHCFPMYEPITIIDRNNWTIQRFTKPIISEYKFSEPASFSACLGVASHSKLASSHHPSSRSGIRRR